MYHLSSYADIEIHLSEDGQNWKKVVDVEVEHRAGTFFRSVSNISAHYAGFVPQAIIYTP